MGSQTATALSHVETSKPYYLQAIDEICNLNWTKLTEEDIIRVAWAYYHFSVQFRECLEIARKMYPDDERLLQLDHGERDTDNLSPWPGVAKPGEKMNHDEFMRRTLELAKIPETGRIVLSDIGKKYLNAVRAIDPKIQALALATYEDGGLERVSGQSSRHRIGMVRFNRHSSIFWPSTSGSTAIQTKATVLSAAI